MTGLLTPRSRTANSRADDVDLHTPVTIRKTVQVSDATAAAGAEQWRELDGRPLPALAVTVSGHQNTLVQVSPDKRRSA